jgi:hypothetical protein
MKKRIVAAALLSAAAAASPVCASVIYEPFNYGAGNLSGNTGWTRTTTGTTDVAVVAGTGPLYPDQTNNPNTGNFAQMGMAGGVSTRFDIGNVNAGAVHLGSFPSGSGTLFYSMALKMTDLTSATTGGGFVAGFNNSAGTAVSTVTQAGARLQIRRDLVDSTKYNLGVRNDVSSTTGTSALAWDTTQFATGDTVFVVEEYEFNLASTTDDVARLWINPALTDFAAASAPATTLSSTGGDINQQQIQSFFLREVNNAAGRTLQIDELRIGGTWADVTPVPEPAAMGVLTLGAFAAFLRRKRQD